LGIAKNHPFLDGDKRAAYVALEVFLELNGLRFTASDADAVIRTLQMAAGDVSDDEFIAWVRGHVGLGAPSDQ
jgi:death-on-curing protein